MAKKIAINRRDFLKASSFSLAALIFQPFYRFEKSLPEYPQGEKLGRVCAGGDGARFDLKARPYADSATVGKIYRDDVFVWLREVVTNHLDPYRINQRWVETPKGYIYLPYVQPVANHPNVPLDNFPPYSKDGGMWVEVSVPTLPFTVNGGNPASPWLKDELHPKLYYSQVMWADQIKNNDNGQILYRLREKYGGYGDVFWAAAEGLKPITPDDLSPIHPDKTDKSVVVNLTYQTLSCFEGKDEVYFCRVSTGYGGATPVGTIPVWRKMVSTHMSGGTTGAGYDTPGIGWTALFSKDGAAIHSTFWHNDFGLARTHGCVNAAPEDAKWIFRWLEPVVSYDPGDITVNGMNASTKIILEEA
ncbi:MAG TPA: L,D-transpeptidase [Anaerolineaceae bacterium]